MTRATYRVVMIPCKSGLYEIKGGIWKYRIEVSY